MKDSGGIPVGTKRLIPVAEVMVLVTDVRQKTADTMVTDHLSVEAVGLYFLGEIAKIQG